MEVPLVKNSGLLCNTCKRVSLVIYRWQDNSPLGVCHHCRVAQELTIEEINMIRTMLVCDRPGCGNEIDDNTGDRVKISLVPIRNSESDDPLDTTEVTWDLCSDCIQFFTDLMTNEEAVKRAYKSYNMSKAYQAKRDAAEVKGTDDETPKEEEGTDDEDTKEAEGTDTEDPAPPIDLEPPVTVV